MGEKKTYEFTNKINIEEDAVEEVKNNDTKEEINKKEITESKIIKLEEGIIKSNEEVMYIDKFFRLDNNFTIYEKAFLTERFRYELKKESEWNELIKKATSERLR